MSLGTEEQGTTVAEFCAISHWDYPCQVQRHRPARRVLAALAGPSVQMQSAEHQGRAVLLAALCMLLHSLTWVAPTASELMMYSADNSWKSIPMHFSSGSEQWVPMPWLRSLARSDEWLTGMNHSDILLYSCWWSLKYHLPAADSPTRVRKDQY